MGIYYENYPNMTEWYSNFLAYNDSRDGKLPLADLENKNISIMNTIASAWLMFAMGLATDANVFLKVIKNIPLCLNGSLTQFIVMPVIGIVFLQIMTFHELGFMPAFMELLPFIVDLGDNKDLFKIPFAAIGENLGIICGALIVGIFISYLQQEIAAKASKIMTPIGYLYVICCAVISLVKFFPYGIITRNILIFAFLNGPIGGALSYLLSYPLGKASNKLTKTKSAKCCGNKDSIVWKDFHTIAIETGNQNAVVSQLIMLSAYTAGEPTPEQAYFLGFIVPFPIFMVLIGQAETIVILITFAFGRLFKNRGKVNQEDKEEQPPKYEDIEKSSKSENGKINFSYTSESDF
ncbi:unnamed protein product [Oikopleura dioica]|uniref:Uncharacterized protein n=1 Tax=Oikopleura dioica TaxID=34765 RepID=E4YDP4_OIKDI|nr:unnamed protein product [Oikopleura dioica]